MKKIISIVLSIVMMITIVPMSVLAKESDAKPINLHKLDGKDLPMHKVVGLPENVYDVVWHTDLDGEYTLATGLIDEDEYFFSYSKDNINFTTSTIDVNDLSVDEDDEIVYINIFEIEYFNGAYYIPCSIYEKDDYSYKNLRTEYMKTLDFTNWSLIQTAPSKVVLPESDYMNIELIGEYNGTFVASDTYMGVHRDEKNGKVCLEYYISSNGQTWTKKQTPYMVASNVEGGSGYETVCDTIFYIHLSSFGVIFCTDTVAITEGVATKTSFSEYYISTDFSTYEKIDLSEIGTCIGGFTENGEKLYYDNIELCLSYIDNCPMLIRNYGMEKVIDIYNVELEYNNFEVCRFDSKENKFVLCEKFDDVQYYTYAFVTVDNYILSFNKSNGSRYLYIRDNDKEFRLYDWKELNSKEFEYLYYPVESTNTDSSANVSWIMGVKDKNKIIVSDDVFKTIYEFSLEKMFDNLNIKCGSKDDLGIYVFDCETVNGMPSETYYYISHDEVKKYINSQLYNEPGDVNGDGNITAVDARIVLQNVAGLTTLDETKTKCADVNGDGVVTAVDARIILQIVAGLK